MLRFLLLRVLPRRLLPVLVIVEIIQFLRHRRRQPPPPPPPPRNLAM